MYNYMYLYASIYLYTDCNKNYDAKVKHYNIIPFAGNDIKLNNNTYKFIEFCICLSKDKPAISRINQQTMQYNLKAFNAIEIINVTKKIGIF